MNAFDYCYRNPVDIPEALQRARAMRSRVISDLGARLRARLGRSLRAVFRTGRARLGQGVGDTAGVQIDTETLKECRGTF